MKRLSNLLRALIENDIDEFLKHLDERDIKDPLGFTPLEIARFLDKRECVNLLKKPHDTSFLIHFKDKRENLSQRQFERAFHIHYLPHLKFRNYHFFKNVIKSCPFAFRRTSLGEEMQRLGMEFKTHIQNAYIADVSVRWIDDTIGFGLFAEKPLKPKAFLGAYTGMFHKLRFSMQENSPYAFQYPRLFWPLRPFAIDAEIQGNLLRFVNHSHLPNLEAKGALDRGLIHIIFLAKRPIESGDELTLNYGKSYWRKRLCSRP